MQAYIFNPKISGLILQTCIFNPKISGLVLQTCIFDPENSDRVLQTCIIDPEKSDRVPQARKSRPGIYCTTLLTQSSNASRQRSTDPVRCLAVTPPPMKMSISR